MSLAKNFNKSLYKQLSIYAAWFPVANTFKLGDYGLIEGGVFRQMGNILKLGINFEQAAGQSASLDFMSAGATVVRTVGNASVDSLPEVGDLEAKLTYSFEKQDSCLIKASLTALQMENIHQVGKELAAHQDWEHRFRVVSAIYQGEHCVIILTQDANTKVEFAGKVNLLKQVELGNVQIKPTVSSSSERVLKCIGDTGVVGLSLFKLGWFNRVHLLESSSTTKDVQVENDWGEDPADDL